MILVLGAGGQVGTSVMRVLGARAVGWTRSDLDLRDLDAIGPTVRAARPTAVVNCAAYTAVDAAETDRETAAVVNGCAVGALADVASRLAVPFVTLSTDYVFDGMQERGYVESDPTAPINVYGSTKREGEMRALRHPGSLVIRTSWVTSGTHRGFLRSILRSLATGSVFVVTDQRGRPTLADDLARTVVDALDRRVAGILHVTNAETMTWFEFARRIAEVAGFDPAIVEPCLTEDLGLAAARPANSVLLSERADSLDIALPGSLGDGLVAAIETALRTREG